MQRIKFLSWCPSQQQLDIFHLLLVQQPQVNMDSTQSDLMVPYPVLFPQLEDSGQDLLQLLTMISLFPLDF